MEYSISDGKLVFNNFWDLDLFRTFNCGQVFRWDQVGESYTGFAGKYPCSAWKDGTDFVVQPLSDPGNYDAFRLRVADYFALNMDYNSLREKFCQDPVMKIAVEYSPGIRVLNQPFFETLITFIISRNNNIPRIKKIVDSMAVKYGDKKGGLYRFPEPQQLSKVTRDEFRQLKMGFRAKYVFDAVQKTLSGEIAEEKIVHMDRQEAEKYLMQIKGVGPKVADCVLLFSCKKYDCFPRDVWINRAMRQLFPRGLPRCVKGFEGIAQQYIFQYSRFNLEK